MNKQDSITLYRPVGPEELELIKQNNYKKWPPRLPEQPFFYPVTNKEYARQIARDWNAPSSGSGYVTRFKVKSEFMNRYPIQKVGGEIYTEWWIPAEDLGERQS